MINLTELRDDLAKLDGEPPYDGPSNICRGDPYFVCALEQKYGHHLGYLRLAAQSTCLCGSKKYRPPHHPWHHANWRPG